MEVQVLSWAPNPKRRPKAGVCVSGHRAAGERLAARWRPRLRDPAPFPAWAFGILQRRCTDLLRRRYRERNAGAPLDEDSAATPSTADTSLALGQAFAALGLAHRTAAVLYYGEGLTLAEIALATDVPVGTARSRLFHARRQLRAHLQGESE